MEKKRNEKKKDTFLIDEMRKMFDNEWVLVEVTELRGPGQPSRGKVLAHHRSRTKIARMTRKFHETHPGKMSYTLFSGDVIPKGVVVVLIESQTEP